MSITIFHNPNCGTSRNVLQMIRDTGVEPEVVEYLKTGWTADQLTGLFAAAGLTPREAMRTRGDLAEGLGLLNEGTSDATILSAMVEHPVLVERPFVRTPRGTVLARPKETVLEVL
ncbi:arsenate reductase (glutaredoxin) [Brevundimonas sp. FT23042]|uniref:arsenate reductase (glutaredoxin) n=1 Tax=Brevundimonas sp. FT23042 TaxID=3393749 RepID=UPI003B589E4F